MSCQTLPLEHGRHASCAGSRSDLAKSLQDGVVVEAVMQSDVLDGLPSPMLGKAILHAFT